MSRRHGSSWIGGVAALLCLGAWAEPAAAQDPSPPQTATTVGPLPISPRGAMVRAMLVPGWGHAAIGSYTRGGFYVALESLTAYTLVRTRNRLGDARERAAFREAFVRETLAREGVTDPEEIQTRLDADDVLVGLDNLVSSRESQQEDLVAFGIFALFLTGADAYVSAHLARFPTPIEVQLSGTPDAMELAVRVFAFPN